LLRAQAEKTRAEAERAGASQFMAKPFGNDEMIAALRRMAGA
jgi:CheY-like chemotaxis protein